MDEQNYNEKFEALTEGMEYEKLYDDLADRVTFIKTLAMHCGEIYREARDAGLPRSVAEQMVMEYFRFETAPSGTYIVRGNGGSL